MALQQPQRLLLPPPWMWLFVMACPVEPGGEPSLDSPSLQGVARGHPLPCLTTAPAPLCVVRALGLDSRLGGVIWG